MRVRSRGVAAFPLLDEVLPAGFSSWPRELRRRRRGVQRSVKNRRLAVRGFFSLLLCHDGGLGLRHFLLGGGLRLLRTFRSVASRRSAAGLTRRVVVEVFADPTMEAAADFERESGALDQRKQNKETQTRSARKEKV